MKYKLEKNLRMFGNVFQAGESVELKEEDYKRLKKLGYFKTKKKKVKDGDYNSSNDNWKRNNSHLCKCNGWRRCNG